MLLKSEYIAPTQTTPEVSLNPDGMIKIKGRSMVPDISELSHQIGLWLDKYLKQPAEVTCIDFYLEYINTTNVKFYISFLSQIESLKLKDKKCIINWYYDEGDEDIIEKGEYISSAIDVPFNFILISDPADI
jgi:hypothetical protein